MRILVVEDDLNLNRLLCATLESEGYSVDNCFNGEDAVLYTDGANFDVYNGNNRNDTTCVLSLPIAIIIVLINNCFLWFIFNLPNL